MSADSSFALLAAVNARLKADAQLAGIVEARVYDMPPQTVVYPYVQQGDIQSLPWEDGGCIDGSELYPQIHTWARGQTASATVHKMNAAIRDCLHNQRFPMVGHTLQSLQHVTTRVLRDPDGITRHGVIDFRAFTTAA